MYGKSTQKTHKVYSVGFNAVADNMGLFIRLAVVTSRNLEITRNSDKIEITAVQGHTRSSILVPIESSYETSY